MLVWSKLLASWRHKHFPFSLPVRQVHMKSERNEKEDYTANKANGHSAVKSSRLILFFLYLCFLCLFCMFTFVYFSFFSACPNRLFLFRFCSLEIAVCIGEKQETSLQPGHRNAGVSTNPKSKIFHVIYLFILVFMKIKSWITILLWSLSLNITHSLQYYSHNNNSHAGR